MGAEGLRHGSSEQVQATIDTIVNAAIDPRNVALTNPLRDHSVITPASATIRGRDMTPIGISEFQLVFTTIDCHGASRDGSRAARHGAN